MIGRKLNNSDMNSMKKLIVFLTTFTLLCTAIHGQNAIELYKRGEENFQGRNWDDALYYYKKAM